MIAELRERFNRDFSTKGYQVLREGLERATGVPETFRCSETPCFFPAAMGREWAAAGAGIIRQLVESPAYMQRSSEAIPAPCLAPGEDSRPLFIQVDFGLVQEAGRIEPRLVEIQGFPSLYAFQPVLAEQYRSAYGLRADLDIFLSGLDTNGYHRLLREAILADEDPRHVVLLEVQPHLQKTRCDFALTEKALGVKAVCLTDVEKVGRQLYYRNQGRRVPIRRIYNRAIADEIERKRIPMPFHWNDELDVTWAGHPNWFFRLSKYSLPFLRHAAVPQTHFLKDLTAVPDDLDNWVLKPLYSFAGLGVVVGPSRRQVEEADASNYILQRRVRFEPVIETPHGPTFAEVRIMFIWAAELTAATALIRMGRGKMMGVDHNRGMDWVGASAAFFAP
ncbi:MAG: circularly permuted type 2 ATP-grasp protein [Acidobacteria bacterium]|nr:circularly permuted type 2 ATP-grasp protein [Acidobacteriota bacterium]